ncbi:unnamed protein product [Ilex paraguariensis]|uniref:DC1 domain-containing protein n=1 Tax=Ilex paraguariensis TaxID=185542 RepID=A0ABC8RN03_9AQUA
MELKNPIHEHPLILKEVHNEEGKKVICYGCREPILDTTYSCKECENYFLHRRCAELPAENKDPRHPGHSLNLLKRSTSKNHSTYMCDVCRGTQAQFTYYCSHCHFNICVLCFLEEPMITLPCHGHQLTLLRRSANFNCNACKLSGKGSSYLCYTCQFWIHKSCALSPTTIEPDYHHHHRLNLNYKYLSSKFSDYKDRCNSCRKEIIDGSWAYRCEAQCKYFVHFECAISTLRGGGRKNEAEMKVNGKDDLDINLIRLPLAGDSLDLVRYFVEHSNQEETKGETTIDHWTHDHQLILVDKHHNNEMKDVVVLLRIVPHSNAKFVTTLFAKDVLISYMLRIPKGGENDGRI